MRNHFSSQGIISKVIDVVSNLILILLHAVKEIIFLVINTLVLCPIALLSSCRNAQLLSFAQVKGFLGITNLKPLKLGYDHVSAFNLNC